MNWFERIKLGLIITGIKADLRQPHNYAMGRVPRGHYSWYTAQQYLYDIERIFRELKVSTSFVTHLPEEIFLGEHFISREDYIMYHQGYFLDLVHQLKDKLCQVVKAVVTPDKEYQKKKSERNTKLSGLLKDRNVKRNPQLLLLLSEWDESNLDSVIAKNLKKRTHYHHYKNPLTNVESYSRARNLRFILDPKFKEQLTEYGKVRLAEEADKNSQQWHSDGAKKMKEALEAAEKNVSGVFKVIVESYKLPSIHNSAGLVNEYLGLDNLVRAKKSSHNLTLISPEIQSILKLVEGLLSDIFRDNLRAVYVIGSIFREDFVPGVSDLNIIAVTKDHNKKQELLASIFLNSLSKTVNVFVEVKLFKESEFLDLSGERARFFCQTDGFLLLGDDLLKSEKLPKICFNLAWLLNKDFKEYVNEVKKQLGDNAVAISSTKLSRMAREFVKRVYRLSFSMVIGNQVIYTPSFQKMRELQNHYYPSNRQINDRLYKYLKGGIKADREVLLSVVESYEEKIMPLYGTLEKYCDKDNPQLYDEVIEG